MLLFMSAYDQGLMHAYVGDCVWACARRMLTVIAARRCMPVLERVSGVYKAHAHGDCSHEHGV
jgi:hypothetical protein